MKSWIRGFLFLCLHLWGKTHDMEQKQRYKRTDTGVCWYRTEAKHNLSVDDVTFQMSSVERHSQAIANALHLIYHVCRVNPTREHC